MTRLIHSPACSLALNCKTEIPTFWIFLYHSAPDQNIVGRLDSGYSVQSLSNLAVNHFSNCRTLSELNRIFARLIRSCFLESHPHPFYWNKIVRSYSKLRCPHTAFRIYIRMLRASVLPDSHSFSCIMKIICHEEAIQLGLQIHSESIKMGLKANGYVESGLIRLYSKAGYFRDARKVFTENPVRRLWSWNAMIGGLSQGGRASEAILMFKDMLRCGFVPDNVTMVCVIPSCGILGDVGLAFQFHKCILQVPIRDNSINFLLDSIMDLYGKCGRMDLAEKVFSRLEYHTTSSWNSLITGYTLQGEVWKAIELFDSMRRSHSVPNAMTFVGVLTACARAGLVEEGKIIFGMMRDVYGIFPNVIHYGCLVDMLGRGGLLEEAKQVMVNMPMNPDGVMWRCLLSACERYGDLKIGEWVVRSLHEIEPLNLGGYVSLSNIYAEKGMWKEVHRVREIIREIRIQNNVSVIAGYSLAAS